MTTNLYKWALISLLSCTVMNPVVVVIHGLVPIPRPKPSCSRCWYIFGDSGYDNGNNNDLNTTVKVNYLPYGIDYPSSIPTGRFTNGKNIPDFIAKWLGYPYSIPPNAYASDSYGKYGINYASGGAGILKETGRNLGQVIPLDVQLHNHEKRVDRFRAKYENRTADKILGECLYTSNMGSNDFGNNFFLNGPNTSYTPEQFATILIKNYRRQLMRLYDLGARKIAVTGLSQIGKAPAVIQIYGNGSDYFSKAVKPFNSKLKRLAEELNETLTGAIVLFISTYNYDKPFNISTTTPAAPCCATSVTDGLCLKYSKPTCETIIERDSRIFWDGFHLTEFFAKIFAARLFKDLSPICTR